jgi:hypothetical protein
MTVTNNYSLTQPLVGGDNNLWGGELNNGAIAAIDAALGANFAVAITGTDVTLTAPQFQAAIFIVSGALTGNRSLVVPLSPNSATVACGGRFVVVNNTTGAFNLTVKTAAIGSVGVVVPQGFTGFLYSDGTNVGFASNGLSAFAQSVNGNPNGQLAGTAGSVNTNASMAFDYAGGNFWICTTTGNAASAVWSQPGIGRHGFDTAVNLQLDVTAAGNILTVAVKSSDTGNDPAPGDPVTVLFQNPGGNSGAPVTTNITGPLSISTVVGATLGSQSGNVPFRFWVVLYYNNGVPVLGLINCSTLLNGAGSVFPIDEAGSAITPTQLSAGATSAGVFYCPNGTVVASSVFRILGYLTYEVGLVTAGTYNNAPTFVRLFGPGVKKPGDSLQTIPAVITAFTAVNSAAFVQTVVTASITTKSAANIIRVRGTVVVQQGQSNAVLQWSRGTTPTLVGVPSSVGGGGIGAGGILSNIPVVAYDQFSPAGLQSYYIFAKNSGTGIDVGASAAPLLGSTIGSTIELEEIMG